jgi:hypothetical protein
MFDNYVARPRLGGEWGGPIPGVMIHKGGMCAGVWAVFKRHEAAMLRSWNTSIYGNTNTSGQGVPAATGLAFRHNWMKVEVGKYSGDFQAHLAGVRTFSQLRPNHHDSYETGRGRCWSSRLLV